MVGTYPVASRAHGQTCPLEFEDDGTSLDFDKVLFNHFRIVRHIEGEECHYRDGEGEAEEYDDWVDRPECFGRGEIEEGFDPSEKRIRQSMGSYAKPLDTQDLSYFCFSGSKEAGRI